jgi:hypothetical protein
MANTFQGMTEDRTAGMTRSRLAQYYRDLGYSPEMAAAKAAVDISNGTAPAGYTGDSPRESMAVRTANDVLAQRREMNDRDAGPENEASMQEFYRQNPRLLGFSQPATPPELRSSSTVYQEYRNPNREEVARSMPQFSSAPPVRREVVDGVRDLPLTPGQITQFVLGQAPTSRTEQILPNAEAEAERQADRVPVPWYRNIPISPWTDRGIQIVPSAMPPREGSRFENEARANSENISRELGQQPGYVAPRENTSSTTNRLIDSALSVITGQPIAPNQPSPQTLTGQGAGATPGQTLPTGGAPALPPRRPFFSYGSADTLAPAPTDDQMKILGGAGGNVPAGPQAMTGAGMYGDQKAPSWNQPAEGRIAPYLIQNPPQAPVRKAGPAAAAAPAQQTPAKQDEPGFFGRIFSAPKDPYEGMSASKLMDIANRNPDNAAAFFRADQALRKEQPDMFKARNADVPAEKRGGPVKGNAAPGKDAALHKALEIIHHMLTRMH